MNAKCLLLLGAFAVVAVVLSASAEASAPAGRYTTIDGTVFDTKTKLTWQQTAPSLMYTWADAKAYCQTPNLPGTGWRLPTRKELQTIVDYSQANPSIDRTAFPATPVAIFWSSSQVMVGFQGYAWNVDFSDGKTGSTVMTNSNEVRCVR